MLGWDLTENLGTLNYPNRGMGRSITLYDRTEKSWSRLGSCLWDGQGTGCGGQVAGPARLQLEEVRQVYRLLDHNRIKQRANVYLSPA